MTDYQTRQLAAILFADIAGYTLLMGEDEDRALRAIYKFKSLAEPLVHKYDGKWHKDLGDGALCSFGSALKAVHCAIDIQKVLSREANFKVRIGIHLGDVTFQNGDVLGDGVNIASRIQGEAAEGGICVSRSVYNTIKNKEGIDTELIGKRKLKNVGELINLYQLIIPGVLSIRKPRERSVSLRYSMLTAILLAMVTGIIVWFIMLPDPEVGKNLVKRLHIELPKEAPLTFTGGGNIKIEHSSLAISPDGQDLVYVANKDGESWLYHRPLNEYKALPLPDTEGASTPFFSPDGQWIGFFANDQLKKISLEGMEPILLSPVSNPRGAVWTRKNEIVVANREGKQFIIVSASNGNQKDINIDLSDNFGGLDFPVLTPDHNHFFATGSNQNIVVASILTGEVRSLHLKGVNPQYTPTGHLLYNLKGRAFIVPFDIEKLEILGPASPVIDDLLTMGGDLPQLALSENGTLVYVAGGSNELTHLVWVDEGGEEEFLPFPPAAYGSFHLSQNDELLAIENKENPLWDIWSLDLNLGTGQRLTSKGNNKRPLWNLAGNKIIFTSDWEGTESIYIKSLFGDQDTKFSPADSIYGIYDISPNGQFLTCRNEKPDLFLLDVSKEGQRPFPVSHNEATEWGGKFSPDGRFVAYTSDESNIYEVYVQPIPELDKKWKISHQGGEEPVWSPSGKEIIYRYINKWWKVKVIDEKDVFHPGKPSLLFERNYRNVYGPSFDIGSDGRLLVLKQVNEENTATCLRVVENWFSEIEELYN